jgi:tryptophan-rich sensory protein
MHPAAALAGFIALVVLAALIGSAFQPSDWYASLRKPPLTPPNWIFGPVWSFLYLCIAVAAWLVWRARRGATTPLALWASQLLLNGLWSLLFFGLHRPGLALLELAILLALVVATTAAFFRVRSLAGALLVPYVLWVGFAIYLNAGIWYLNR